MDDAHMVSRYIGIEIVKIRNDCRTDRVINRSQCTQVGAMKRSFQANSFNRYERLRQRKRRCIRLCNLGLWGKVCPSEQNKILPSRSGSGEFDFIRVFSYHSRRLKPIVYGHTQKH